MSLSLLVGTTVNIDKLAQIIFAYLSVRGITCKSYNIYHLKKLKLCLFNNEFESNLFRLHLKLFTPRSNFRPSKI